MKNISLTAKVSVFAVAFALVISPIVSSPVLAKNDKKNDVNAIAVSSTTDPATGTSFFTKFKNFFLPPGIAKKSKPLPPGIAKKISTSTNATSTPNNPPATTTPDVTAPSITNISVFNVGQNSADVYWLTNEKASGKLYIATSSPAVSKAFSVLSFAGKEYFHHLQATNLQASTSYVFVITATDEAGNTSTSSEQSLITKSGTDRIVPTISSIIASTTSSTTATVSWVTNELATGAVYFSTTTPVVQNASSTVSTSTPALVRELALTGLTASTTYYFTVSSADLAGNTAVVIGSQFTTPQQ